MREDQKEDAMIVAMSAYAKLAGKGAAPDLQRIAASDPSLRVRAAAKQALADRFAVSRSSHLEVTPPRDRATARPRDSKMTS